MKGSPIAGQRLSSGRVWLALASVVAAAVLVLTLGSKLSQPAHQLNASGASPAKQVVGVGQVPLSFEPNQGQTDSQVLYLSRGVGHGLFLTSNEAVLKLQHTSPDSKVPTTEAVHMRLVGGSPRPVVSGTEGLPAKSNYLVGNNPAKWHTNIPHYGRVRYQQVYPGIDLVYYGNQGRLEYDFNVAAGADPRVIQLSFAGQRQLSVDQNGDLVLHTSGGVISFQAPIAYQQINGNRRPVRSSYLLTADNHVRFALGEYDHNRALIIDPALNYSTYLGGPGAESCGAITGTTTPRCPAVAVDPGFNYYVAGATTSATFPGAGSGVALAGGADVFVSKFDFGNNLLFTTYIGGTGDDTTAGVAADAAGNIYLAGTTTSTDFPTANGFNNGPTSGGKHVFVSELKPDASGLLYSTYLAGGGTDTASGLAIDGKGAAFVMGITDSVSGTTFPTTPTGLQPTSLSSTDPQFFVAKIDTTKTGNSSLIYSTFFGGANAAGSPVVQGGGIAVDSSGKVYITGGTNYQHLGNSSTDFPILNAAQPCLDNITTTTACPSATNPDAFVAKIDPGAIGSASLLYSSYLGGSGTDTGYGIAVDSGSNVYVTGATNSTDSALIPSSSTPYQGTFGGGASDAFLARLNNPASGAQVAITYFTYMGAGGDDLGAAVAVDSSSNARVTGWTSGAFPSAGTTNFTPGPLGGGDAFVARIDPTGSSSAVNFVSAFGGSGLDHGTGVALDPNFFTYVVGDTASGNFPTAGSPLPQGGISGSSDAFVSKLQPVSDLQLTKTTPASAIGVGNPITFKYTVTNAGPDPTGGITFVDNVPSSGATFGTITSSPGTCTAPTAGIAQCAIGTLTKGGTATVNVTMTPTTATPAFQNSGSVSANAFSIDPVGGNNATSISVAVNDFSLSVSPSSQTVTAGQQPPATYQVTVTPNPTYPNSVSLTCSSGLPSAASCTFSTTSVTMSNTSPATSTLTISTTARPVTTTWLRRGSAILYAVFLPVGGFTLLGAGMTSRRRKWLLGICVIAVIGGIFLQAGCGSSSSSQPATGGTPRGTYNVVITGTSGSATRSQTVQLTVN